MPGQKITISSITYSSIISGIVLHTGTFRIAENYPGAIWAVLATDTPILLSGELETPIVTAALADNTSYKVECVLGCGTSFIKVINIGAGCPAVSNVVSGIYGNSSFERLVIMFTPVPGISNYSVRFYKYELPGEVGSEFIASYNVNGELGFISFSQNSLLLEGVQYYFVISTICGEGIGAEIAPEGYIAEKITATVDGINDPGGVIPGITITVTISETSTGDITFSCTYKLLNGTVIGPKPVIVSAGMLTGSYNEGGNFGELDLTPSSFKILNSSPSVSVEGKLISY